jgi:hypothetical protein
MGKYYKRRFNFDTYSLVKIKEVVNCILEHGAYSDKNYEMQMSKKSKNYNENEKLLVTMSYKFKKFEGEKLQKELFEFLSKNVEFLEYLKTNDLDLYYEIQKLIKHDN